MAQDNNGTELKVWQSFLCSSCGAVVLAHFAPGRKVHEEPLGFWPEMRLVPSELPEKPRRYMEDALASAPAGAIMVTASAVDSMLKDKGLTNGSLNTRINEAARQGLITKEMAAWAHEIRLDANDQRHADDNAPLPTPEDARRCVDFAMALAQFLYVLPALVARGHAAIAP